MDRGEIYACVEKVLEGQGFEVYRDSIERGVSGLSHGFHLVAKKGVCSLIIELVDTPTDLLLSLAKIYDVRGFTSILLVKEEVLATLTPSIQTFGVNNIISFKTLEELEVKLRRALGAQNLT
ncbi:MAG: hypothetical protein N3E41_01845 [Thermofilaceae archaeon]|nr:hypothetical protein [Thermofilaceae archaeon]